MTRSQRCRAPEEAPPGLQCRTDLVVDGGLALRERAGSTVQGPIPSKTGIVLKNRDHGCLLSLILAFLCTPIGPSYDLV